MTSDGKIVERKLLIKRAFPVAEVFEIGKKLGIHYFDQFVSGWGKRAEERKVLKKPNLFPIFSCIFFIF